MVQKTLIRHKNERPVPMPKMEIKGYDQDVVDRYDALTSRRGELLEELAAVNGEINTILVNLGALVASGKSFMKQTARLEALRRETEALGAGVRYIDGQIELLKRSNYWLKTR